MDELSCKYTKAFTFNFFWISYEWMKYCHFKIDLHMVCHLNKIKILAK